MKKGREPLGAIPTPLPIVKLMVDIAFGLIRNYLSEVINVRSIRILDNSVGDGRFLFEIVDHQKKLQKSDQINSYLVLHGLDINNESIRKCELIKEKFSSNSEIDISFKAGNALIGYIKANETKEGNPTKEKLNISFFEDSNIKYPTVKLQDTAFHWFYEWPIPNATDGYDLCIGNPPFGISFSSEEKNIYKKLYKGVDPEIESYLLFVERSVYLLREGGVLIFLIPNNFTTNFRYQKFREFLLKTLNLKKIIMLDSKIFPSVSVETCIVVGYKKSKDEKNDTNIIEFSKFSVGEGFTQIKKNEQVNIMDQKFKYIMPNMASKITDIIGTIEKNALTLGDIAYISRGIELGFNSKFTSKVPITKESVPLIAGRNIQKFVILGEKRYIEFDSTQKSIYKNKSMYTKPKLLVRRIGHELVVAYDPNNLFCVCDVYIITLKSQWSQINLKHLEIILNSSLLTFYLNHKFLTVKTIFPKIPISYLKQLPIKLPFSLKEEGLIEKMTIGLESKKGVILSQLEEVVLNHYRISKIQKQLIKSFKLII
ncbi:MAG: TaqI-like C-terminal specificity domain-containing protein [Candidatus Hodarchaeales archaeon]